MSKYFVGIMNIVAVVVGSVLMGQEFGVKIGIAVGLLSWALITPIK